ncbi:MAG: hypothetical protein ACR2PR_01735 [Pseudohongiellaceae bacterium]
MMAKTIGAGVATTVTAAAIIGLWSVGGFVTNQAYAEDQHKLDTIIELLTYTQERKALVSKISNLNGDVSDAKAYLDATDPDADIYTARHSRWNRLNTDLTNATLALDELDMERAAQ